MRITYAVHTRFPAEKAYGLQITAVCRALADMGHDVTIVAPFTKNYIHEPVHEYYGLPGSIKFIRLKNYDALGKRWIPGFLWMVITMYFYRKELKKFLSTHSTDLIYVRSPHILAPLLESKMPVVLELHTIPNRFKKRFISLCNKCKRVVCLTTPMQDELIKLGVYSSRVIVEGDGVDFDKYQNVSEDNWDLSSKPVIGYVGSLITQYKIEKGIPELMRAVKELKDKGKNVFCWIVGGPDDWKKAYEELASSIGLTEGDIRFEGRVDQAKVPLCITKCDVCVYPAPASSHPYFMRDTSPLKLLEYLAVGKPTVCADIPPVRDCVDENIVEFCDAGDSLSLADAIGRALDDRDEVKVGLRKEQARYFDWRRRMERVLSGI
ncbi:glycosyltransferase family 4 protein [Patescibacteria group bacterium]|nr:glycosyltransferase family 4 protein [Patescibacteria group bacterium]